MKKFQTINEKQITFNDLLINWYLVEKCINYINSIYN